MAFPRPSRRPPVAMDGLELARRTRWSTIPVRNALRIESGAASGGAGVASRDSARITPGISLARAVARSRSSPASTGSQSARYGPLHDSRPGRNCCRATSVQKKTHGMNPEREITTDDDTRRQRLLPGAHAEQCGRVFKGQRQHRHGPGRKGERSGRGRNLCDERARPQDRKSVV